jgi:hypothetical protein
MYVKCLLECEKRFVFFVDNLFKKKALNFNVALSQICREGFDTFLADCIRSVSNKMLLIF